MTILNGMTQGIWDALTPAQCDSIRDLSGLTPQLLGLEGKRVQVTGDDDSSWRRFWVGRSTGWRPCHIEIKTRRSFGGIAAYQVYKSVRVIDHGPRR